MTFKVTKEGEYLLDAQKMSLEQVAAKIKSLKSDDPELRAVIAADKGVEYGKVIELIDTIKLNGIEKFALNIQRKL